MASTRRRCQFEIYRDAQHHWRWRLRDTEDRVVAVAAEEYASRDAVADAVQNVRSCFQSAETEGLARPASGSG